MGSLSAVVAVTAIGESGLGLWMTQEFNTDEWCSGIEATTPNFYAEALIIRRRSDNGFEALSNTN
jgi:hypothetical protein